MFLVNMMDDADELREALEGLRLDECERAFFPLNDHEALDRPGGTHWSLLEFRRASNEFVHWDSHSSSNDAVASRVACRLRPLLTDASPAFRNGDCPQQTNHSDCGVYCVFLAEQLSAGVDESDLGARVTPASVAAHRGELLKRIENIRE
jgi:hypothetical protein